MNSELHRTAGAPTPAHYQELAIAIVENAIDDLFSTGQTIPARERADAREFLAEPNEDLNFWCDFLDVDTDTVQRAISIVLSENGEAFRPSRKRDSFFSDYPDKYPGGPKLTAAEELATRRSFLQRHGRQMRRELKVGDRFCQHRAVCQGSADHIEPHHDLWRCAACGYLYTEPRRQLTKLQMRMMKPEVT